MLLPESVFRKQLAFLQIIEDDTRKGQEDWLHIWMGFKQTGKYKNSIISLHIIYIVIIDNSRKVFFSNKQEKRALNISAGHSIR